MNSIWGVQNHGHKIRAYMEWGGQPQLENAALSFSHIQ